jgi:hypothetical protein
MRSVFFVPQPGTFTGADLTRLEAEAAANPGAKGALLRHLHVRRPSHSRYCFNIMSAQDKHKRRCFRYQSFSQPTVLLCAAQSSM